jgi:hypothetical protein
MIVFWFQFAVEFDLCRFYTRELPAQLTSLSLNYLSGQQVTQLDNSMLEFEAWMKLVPLQLDLSFPWFFFSRSRDGFG